MGDCALKMHEITAGYGSNSLFSGFSAELKTGKITSLVGLSGCGKSTLLRIAAGLETPQSGSVAAHTKEHSMVFQRDALLKWRNATDNVALPLELRRVPDAKDQALQILEEVGLGEDACKKPGEMSGGMRMRCAAFRPVLTAPIPFARARHARCRAYEPGAAR